MSDFLTTRFLVFNGFSGNVINKDIDNITPTCIYNKYHRWLSYNNSANNDSKSAGNIHVTAVEMDWWASLRGNVRVTALICVKSGQQGEIRLLVFDL